MQCPGTERPFGTGTFYVPEVDFLDLEPKQETKLSKFGWNRTVRLCITLCNQRK